MKTIKMVLAFLFIVVGTFPREGYAGIDFNPVYGLMDKASLEKIVAETEKTNPSDQESLKLLGIAYHNLSVLKVRGASEKAVECLERASKIDPEDYEVLVYHGSAKTLVARDSWNVVTKVRSTNRGINMMDKAVRKSPDNVPIRMVRGNNSLALAKMFNRREIAKEDFLNMEKLINTSGSDIYPEVKAEVFFHLGMLYKEEKDSAALSKEYFRRAVQVSPNSKWGIEAKKY